MSLVEATRTLPSTRSYVMLSLRPPRHPTEPDMALSLRGRWYAAVVGMNTDPAHDAADAAWVRAATGAFAAVGHGAYIGDVNLAQRSGVPVLSDAALARLERIRDDRAPDRVFAGWFST